jgi:hypothetical protein
MSDGESVAPPPSSNVLPALGALGLVIALFAVGAFPVLANSIARASFAYANLQWSEGPLILQLHRLALDQAAYLSTSQVNSYDYGPLYVSLLSTVRALFGLPDGIVAYRTLSIVLGLLAVVPFAYAAIAIAARAGLARSFAAKAAIAAGAVLLGISVMARSVTFDTLHPDNLAFLMIATALALHFAIAARAVPPVTIWALVAIGILSALSKQSSAAVVPILLAGLAGAGVVPVRRALVAFAALAVGIVLLVIAMPQDVRAWTVLVPAAQPYEFWLSRIVECLKNITSWQAYIGISFVSSAIAIGVLIRRDGRRAALVDAAALLSVAIVAFAGYFKTLGIWNNLSFLCLGTVPYAAALLGFAFDQRLDDRDQRTLALGSLATLCALGLALLGGTKPVPDAQINQQMSAVFAAAKRLCATNQSIMVTTFPDAFFGCPYAEYALGQSYTELQAAYPKYYVGKTVFDQPTNAHYVVAYNNDNDPPILMGLPAWYAAYRLVDRLPTVHGWGQNFYPVQFRVFEHR